LLPFAAVELVDVTPCIEPLPALIFTCYNDLVRSTVGSTIARVRVHRGEMVIGGRREERWRREGE
jgi:hypothetical protein